MGLNEEYNHTKDQILLMDPMPQLNKVYSMLLKVDKQRNTCLMLLKPMQMNALLTKTWPGPGAGQEGQLPRGPTCPGPIYNNIILILYY